MAEEQEVEVEVEEEPSEFAQHMLNAADAFGKQWGSLIPDDFWTYGKEARKEFLLGMRSLVDGAIERIERDKDAPAGSTRGRTKAKVQVD